MPYQHQSQRRRDWREELHDREIEERRARARVLREESRARKAARAKRYAPVDERIDDFRRQYDERMRRKRG